MLVAAAEDFVIPNYRLSEQLLAKSIEESYQMPNMS